MNIGLWGPAPDAKAAKFQAAIEYRLPGAGSRPAAAAGRSQTDNDKCDASRRALDGPGRSSRAQPKGTVCVAASPPERVGAPRVAAVTPRVPEDPKVLVQPSS